MPKSEQTEFTPLKPWVSVERSFQRAMRLDRDRNAQDALAGYVAQGTARRALETMAAHILESSQRAFTWTGPYGCGKSSLAILLCSLVGSPAERRFAAETIGLEQGEPIDVAFQANSGWCVDIMVGREGNLTADLAARLEVEADGRTVVKALEERAAGVKRPDGHLLVIDELGKYLEAECASENAYLLQEIAEVANRSKARFVFLGILHQAVDVYASRLPRAVRDEWAKVQGRFADIPLLSSSEETVELLGHAISRPQGEPPLSNRFRDAVKLASEAFAERRPEAGQRIAQALTRCWPLNPVTALLLGPISRRKFAQNERSIYSFLSAADPLGFKRFTEQASLEETYDPADYWDYLKENFETALLTSGEGHRWLTAVEAVSRAERRGSTDLVRLAKSIALIDLFRTGSGIEATPEVLAASVGMTKYAVQRELKTLIELKVVIERRYANAFAIFAGSDFDIEASVKDALAKSPGFDPAVVTRLVSLTPVVARDHYLRVGTLRWFERRILPAEHFSALAASKANFDGAAGDFVLLLPESSEDELTPDRLRTIHAANGLSAADARRLVIGTSPAGHRIRELLEELQALSIVEKDPTLEGDETGRAEVRARVGFVREALLDALSGAFAKSVWFHGSQHLREIARTQDLNAYATYICDEVFSGTPVINNELVNRDHLSSQMVAARRELMTHMVVNEAEERLGFEGFPPAYALYLSLLKDLHREVGGHRRFVMTEKELCDSQSSYGPLWIATKEFLKRPRTTSGKELFDFWSKAPFGLKAGPMPVLALAFYLTNRENLAVYLAGAFESTMSATTIDEWLVDPTRIGFRWVETTQENEAFLRALAETLPELAKRPLEPTPLSVAKAIVAIVLKAPRWSQRSTAFTPETLRLKNVVAKASDPIQLLYRDIPAIYNAPVDVSLAERVTASLREYVAAMPSMLENVREHLFAALEADNGDLEALHARAKNIKGLSGDMTLEAFIARLETFDDAPHDIEGIISLATSRPAQMWTDREVLTALSRISELAFAFRKQESFARLRGRSGSRRVLNVVLGAAEGDLNETIELSPVEDAQAKSKAAGIADFLAGVPREVALAALSEAGLIVAHQKED